MKKKQVRKGLSKKVPLEYRQTFRRRRKTCNQLGGENPSKLFLRTERRAQMKECAMGSKETVVAGTQGQTRQIPRDCSLSQGPGGNVMRTK